jgi:hypothetical protein
MEETMEDLMRCVTCDSPAHLTYPAFGTPTVMCECSNPNCRLYSAKRFAPSALEPTAEYDEDKPRPQWLWLTHHHDFG